MSTRVTNLESTTQFINQIQQQRSQLERARQEIGSGVKIATPGDNPGQAAIITGYQSTIQMLDRYQKRIGFADSILQHQDTTLDSAQTLLLRAQEIAEQAGNGAVSTQQRSNMAIEVFQLRDTLVALANTTYQGRYIYGGADDDDPPFVASSVPYTVPAAAGPAKTRYVFDTSEPNTDVTRSAQVSDSENVRITTTGSEVFSHAIGALETLGRALSGYRTGLDAQGLPDGSGTAFVFPQEYSDQTASITAAIDQINDAITTKISVERTDVASRQGRLENIKNGLSAIKITAEQSRSDLQDVDMFEVASRFANLQTSLQGLLTSGVQLNNLSILNFI